jgi:hypothetical protein
VVAHWGIAEGALGLKVSRDGRIERGLESAAPAIEYEIVQQGGITDQGGQGPMVTGPAVITVCNAEEQIGRLQAGVTQQRTDGRYMPV